MAKINFLTAYPTATPAADSIVIGSLAANGATNNFLMSAIATYVMSAPVSTITLQQVCDQGAVTTTGITVGGVVDINSTADISDTLTLSKATGNGLDVTADVLIGGDVDANGRLSVAELVHAELAVGTGLQVDANATIGGRLTAGTSVVDQAYVAADAFQTNSSSFTATSSAVSTSFGTTFTTFDATIVSCKITGSAPASATAAGTTGPIVTDSGYIYVCTATDTWTRVAVATW